MLTSQGLFAAATNDHRRHDYNGNDHYYDIVAGPSATKHELKTRPPVARPVAAVAIAGPSESASADAARLPRLGCAAAAAAAGRAKHGRSLSADAGAEVTPVPRLGVAVAPRRFFSERRLVPRTTCRIADPICQPATPTTIASAPSLPPRPCPCCSDRAAADRRALTWPIDGRLLACGRAARPLGDGGDRPLATSVCGPAGTLPPLALSSRPICDASFFDNFSVFADDASDSHDDPDEPVYESVRYCDDDGDDFDVVEHSDFYKKSTAARLHSAPPALPPRPPYLLLPPPPLRPALLPLYNQQEQRQPQLNHNILTTSRSLPDIAPVDDASAAADSVACALDEQRPLFAAAAARGVESKRRPAGLELWANRIQMGVAARRAWEEKYVIEKLGRE